MNRLNHLASAILAVVLLSAGAAAQAQEVTAEPMMPAVSATSRAAVTAEVIALQRAGQLDTGNEGPALSSPSQRAASRQRAEVQAETLNALRQAMKRPYAERWALGQV